MLNSNKKINPLSAHIIISSFKWHTNNNLHWLFNLYTSNQIICWKLMFRSKYFFHLNKLKVLKKTIIIKNIYI